MERGVNEVPGSAILKKSDEFPLQPLSPKDVICQETPNAKANKETNLKKRFSFTDKKLPPVNGKEEESSMSKKMRKSI